MAKLHDIIPPQHRVVIATAEGDQEVDVRGLDLEDITNLMARYPEVIEQLDGNKLDASALLKMGPKIIAAVMAYGCGAPNDPGAEQVLMRLPLGTQVDILNIIVKETAPNGIGPFVKLMKALGLDLDMVRQKAASAKQSAPPSISSSEPDTITTQ